MPPDTATKPAAMASRIFSPTRRFLFSLVCSLHGLEHSAYVQNRMAGYGCRETMADLDHFLGWCDGECRGLLVNAISIFEKGPWCWDKWQGKWAKSMADKFIDSSRPIATL